MISSTVLSIRDFSVRFPAQYGDVAIVDRVSLSIGAGQSLGVVGESGSGKSLIGLASLGLLPGNAEASGSVVVDDIDLLHAPASQKARLRGKFISYIYQDALSALNPIRRIKDQFKDVWSAAHAEERRGWREKTMEALERVSLRNPEKVMNSYPGELSGGMRQRALIAMAVVRRPSLLIADEPTTALDRSTAKDVLKLLGELQRDMGMAMLLISHDLDVVRQSCEQIAVIYAGQLCEAGTASTIAETPRHRYTRALLEAVDSLACGKYPIKGIPGMVPNPVDFGPGCRFFERCGTSTEICRTPRPHMAEQLRDIYCHNPVALEFTDRASA